MALEKSQADFMQEQSLNPLHLLPLSDSLSLFLPCKCVCIPSIHKGVCVCGFNAGF